MCCSGPSWKREVVPDHKFDFIDTREFHSKGCGARFGYLWLYVLVVKSFLVYVSDVFTAVTMMTTKGWANTIFNSCPSTVQDCFIIPFNIGKWLFLGCIIFSFLLLAYETRKARKIINSRDISYAYTNVMANNYYSLRSYDHFCFFSQINNSTKKKDTFAFFVFFTFKSWKRVLFADGPRQTINALTLYSFYLAKNQEPGGFFDLRKYSDNFITLGLIITTLFTVLVFIGSMLLLLAAGVCYIPLLCYIQGNLKEYCCHKVDKRIADLMKRKLKQRQVKAAALAKKEAAGDFSHLKNKKGEYVVKPLPQPTLPSVKLDDFDDTSSMSTATRVDYGYYTSDDKKGWTGGPSYPPMPGYQTYNSYENYGGYEYDDRYAASQVTLTQAAAPIAGYRESNNGSGYLPNPYSARAQDQYFFEENRPEYESRRSSGLAYDQDYPSVTPQHHPQYR